MSEITKLTKSALLENTEGGFLYFEKLFPQLKSVRINDRKCKNVINHIRGEKHPSLTCYFKADRWFLYDHADPDFSGDMYTIYKKVNGEMDFKLVMKAIYEAVFGEPAPEVESGRPNAPNIEKAELPDDFEYLLEEITIGNLGNDERQFLEKNQILSEVFQSMDSVFLNSYTFKAQSGETYKINKKQGEVIIGHKFNGSVKIYKPCAEEYKFMWLGEKPKDYLYGLEKLKELCKSYNPKCAEANNQSKPLKVVLCAGERDTLCLRSNGINAFCLNSETTTYFPEWLFLILMDLHDFCEGNFELVIVYDRDKTGKKQAQRILDKQSKYDYNIRIVELPEILSEKGGKDVSDWITLGLPKQQLMELIIGEIPLISDCSPEEDNIDTLREEEQLSPVSPVSPQDDNCDEPNEIENRGQESTFEVSKDLEQQFPQILRKALEPFDSYYRTMMLFSFLTVLGSVFRNVIAKFRRDKLYPNLYTVIIAPPASGKSLIKWARALIMKVENFLKTISDNELEEYNGRMEKFKKGEIDRSELGKKPSYKVQVIPCDITAAMWVKQASENDGYGLMYDTEIDGLVESNSGQLRSFTDYLRKAYEGEPLMLMRKTDGERICVEEGKMSLLLSGTPRQFFKLTPDAENGLFSRIIPLKLDGLNQWQDAFETEEFDFQNYFDDLALEAFNFFQELDSLPEPVTFSLTKEQLIKLDREFKERTKRVNQIAGVDGRATVFRLGAITVKIAMILNTLRRLENNELHNQYECSSQDFDSAMSLTGIILEHVLNTLRMMNNVRVDNMYRGKRLDFYYSLPDDFSYSDSQQVAEELKIKSRTAQNWLYRFRDDGFLINYEKGRFRKVD